MIGFKIFAKPSLNKGLKACFTEDNKYNKWQTARCEKAFVSWAVLSANPAPDSASGLVQNIGRDFGQEGIPRYK